MVLEFEKKYLDDLLMMLKMYNPVLYKTLYYTGNITSKIGQVLGIEEPQYYFAGFYANLGFLSIDRIVQKKSTLEKSEYSTVKRHPHLSSRILQEKGMNLAAEYVEAHHELPSGNGYYKLNAYPIESAFINIADVFQGCITHKTYRPSLTFKEAEKVTFLNYENNLLLDKDILNAIKKVLRDFYVEL